MHVKILVADDSKTNLTIISAALKKLGHEAILANNGQQAIELFKQERPDLIILDVVMEGIDGFESAKQIRELDSDDWIPIIFLSASVDDTSIAKGIDAGGDDYLTKPFSEITLEAKIKAMQRIADMRKRLCETTKKLYLLSSTDVLTGVYNRLQFDKSIKEILANADRYKHYIALLFIDLDNFKNVNDTFGHHIGDLLLVEVAKRLQSCLREGDFLARLGGDEFALILREVPNPAEAGNVAEKIIQEISRDYYLEGHHIRHGVSIGVAVYPDSMTNKENIILNADIAMYHAKASGRNNFKYFTLELNEKYKQHINLEEAIKFAQEKEELFLTYQPIFHLKTKKISGVEATLCWSHPKYGLIPTNIFIPIAEESGLMPRIGFWALKKACEESIDWPLDKYNHFKFSINISSSQLLDHQFIEELKNIIKYTQLSAKRLELELTESTILSYAPHLFIEKIKMLHDLGINIAIKDFGTGHSSFIRLKQLAINTLKIEKTFVEDALIDQNTEVIMSSLILLGKNLNLDIVAEGIQTNEQLEYLIKKECPYGQGSLLCKPLKSDSFAKFIEKAANENELLLTEK